MVTTTYHSPLGDIVLAADERGLTGLWFAGQKHFGAALCDDALPFDMHTGAFTAAEAAGAQGSPEDIADAAGSAEDAIGGAVSDDSAEGLEGCPDARGNSAEKTNGAGNSIVQDAGLPSEHIAGSDALSGSFGMTAEDARNATAVRVLERAWGWLNAYFAGQEPRWIPPLHLEGTELQHAVWVALLEIPYGQTIAYDELVHKLERRRGSVISHECDSVDAAVACNPVSIIVPGHRVVGAGGAPMRYAGGLDRQRALLELESACESVS